MKHKSKAVFVILCLIIVIAVPQTPASAASAAVVEFVGEMRSSDPVYLPTFDPTGVVKHFVIDAPSTDPWSLPPTFCVIQHPDGIGQTNCELWMQGDWYRLNRDPPRYAPSCIGSEAYGNGILSSSIRTWTFDFVWTHTGTTVVMTGDASSGGEEGLSTALFELIANEFRGDRCWFSGPGADHLIAAGTMSVSTYM